MQQDFTIAGYGEHLAIGRECQRGQNGRLEIDGGADGDGLARFLGRVVFAARGDPVAHQVDLLGGKRRQAERHLRLHFAREIRDK